MKGMTVQCVADMDTLLQDAFLSDDKGLANGPVIHGHRHNLKHMDTLLQDAFLFDDKGLANGPVIHGHRHNLKHRFELKKTLGEGTYGKVKLAVERSTGEHFAIKYIKKTKIRDEHDLNRIRREIKIMSTIQHPNVVNVNEVFENKDKIILVMECATGGELYDYINNNQLSERDARRIFRQIVSAIKYCHKNGIVHRDLKLENILLDNNNNAKIADFGLSNYYTGNDFLKTFCGSPLYASPEIVNGQPYYGPEVDCWSLGVVLYTLVYGIMPFDGSNFKKLRTQITTGDYYEPDKPSEAAGLIRHLLTVNPAKRATITDICSHWWVNLGHSLMPDNEPYIPPKVLQPVSGFHNQTLLSSSSESDEGESDGSSCKQNVVKPLKGILKKPKMANERGDKATNRIIDCNMNLNLNPANSCNSTNSRLCNEIMITRPKTDSNHNEKENPHGCQQLEMRADEEDDHVFKETFTTSNDTFTSNDTLMLAQTGTITHCDITSPSEMLAQSLCTSQPPSNANVNISDNNVTSSHTSLAMTSSTSDTLIDGASSKKVPFDSQVMPKRGILKRKGKFSTGDSGCDLNDSNLSRKESVCLSVHPMDLSEVDSAIDSPDHLNVDRTFGASTTSVDTDSSSAQSGAFVFGASESLPSRGCTGLISSDNVTVVTSNTSVVPRRRGILKGANRDSDKRLSACSIGSNSSADILDFSYDSSDEVLTNRFCTTPSQRSPTTQMGDKHSQADLFNYAEASDICKKALELCQKF